jgi:hypothetical protein
MPIDDQFAGGFPAYMGVGYDATNGTILCYEVTCIDSGYRNSIFVNLYVGVPSSNCFPKRSPFGATSICITQLVEVFTSSEINQSNIYESLLKYTITEYSSEYLKKLFRSENSTIRVRDKMINLKQKLLF